MLAGRAGAALLPARPLASAASFLRRPAVSASWALPCPRRRSIVCCARPWLVTAGRQSLTGADTRRRCP